MADFYEKFDVFQTADVVELTVNDTKRADEFDDFLNEVCDIPTYLKPCNDGLIFVFVPPFGVEDVQALVERFKPEKSK